MKKIHFLFSLLFALTLFSCQKDDDASPTSDCIDESQISPTMCCFEIYAPVCGCDGVTYPNGCMATYGAGVKSYTNGPCEGGHDCIDPALIEQGHTIDCSYIYEPVCGCDGITYANSCIAQYVHGVKYYKDGPCHNITNCIDSSLIQHEIGCTLDYNPVCGCNGVTYPNECVAKFMHGVVSSTPGECPTPTCIKERIETLLNLNYAGAKIDRYYYNNEYVYLADPGQGVAADAGYEVIGANCQTICYFGGFTPPDGQLCNGDNFFQTATYLGTVWEW